jgi:hypothetical protein
MGWFVVYNLYLNVGAIAHGRSLYIPLGMRLEQTPPAFVPTVNLNGTIKETI